MDLPMEFGRAIWQLDGIGVPMDEIYWRRNESDADAVDCRT